MVMVGCMDRRMDERIAKKIFRRPRNFVAYEIDALRPLQKDKSDYLSTSEEKKKVDWKCITIRCNELH